MEETTLPETRTVGRNGGTHASAVSKMLMNLGYTKFAQYDTTQGGYYCSNWGEDTEGGLKVKVEFRRPGRGLKGKPSEDTVNRVRRAKLTAMANDLRSVGYYVSWGWDDKTGDPDTSFIVASVNPPREGDVPGQRSPENAFTEAPEAPEAPEELTLSDIAGAAREHLSQTLEPPQNAPEPESVPEPPQELETAEKPREGLWAFLISIPQIEETVREIHRAHNAGKDDAARRMEHTLYQKVLLAIVGGGLEDPRHLAAAALATQHLSFAR
jgi:hypothetical protein